MIGVKEIWQEDATTLGILWTDHKKDLFDVYDLRSNCPCAVCVDEHSGKRIATKRIEQKPKTIKSVGQYALSIHFEDGHSTGIYTFNMLRMMKTTHETQ